MRYHAKLTVHDGQVLCPRIAGWRDLEDCVHCKVLETINEDDRGRQTVVCSPEVERPLVALSKMVRS